ncbi:monovalent cation:proton antiporter-2 (CPA2) family protein, partial [Mesorhizobium sp.]|uniref:monovalent cation:proton antiporter-2 (CPA2) family protein n=1 Tax=Mesorhizobium sp. TaxID=1871066 RepID=UPI0025C01EF6
MPHDTPLIATIVAGLGLAFVFGALANRFRIPPLVGYLVAGVLVGPNTPGFVADASLANELAEIGVILLMFGVGLHFSLKDLLSVRAIAVPGAIVQIGFATLLGVGLAWLLGWSLGAGLVFGLALSVASTVVLLRALQERRLIESERGRIAVGWLIVEDLAMVLALVLLPALAGVLGGQPQVEDHTSLLSLPASYGIWGVVGITLAKVAAFVVVMLVVGRRVIPWILHYVAHTGSRELFRLSVLAIALGVAFGAAKLFGVSLALGAFFAGMIMSESELSHRAAEESLPLRDAFSVLFFVSVGMLFDPLS